MASACAPALALLAGGATGNICPSHLDLAVILELIHAATLVHDDILDGAEKRRGQPTANAKWGQRHPPCSSAIAFSPTR
ncbi:MAG: polyprenyl synthetase family protein [Chthoniobacter sp.]